MSGAGVETFPAFTSRLMTEMRLRLDLQERDARIKQLQADAKEALHLVRDTSDHMAMCRPAHAADANHRALRVLQKMVGVV